MISTGVPAILDMFAPGNKIDIEQDASRVRGGKLTQRANTAQSTAAIDSGGLDP